MVARTVAHMGNSPNVNWPLSQPDRVLIAGDWHGNTRAAQVALETAATLRAPLVLQLGDFGLWPGHEGEHYLTELEAHAENLNILIAWVDGNHEDFTQLNATPISDDGLQWQRPHIAHLPRGSRWTWHGIRFAALGGATSLDRPH